MKTLISIVCSCSCGVVGALAVPAPCDAREVRSAARTSVSRGASPPNVSRRTNVGANNVNANRNVNRNVNVNHNVDVNHHVDIDVDVDHDYHPWAAAAAVTTAAVVTGAVIGSIVRSVPPSCQTVVVNGTTYSQCGSTWYMPQMQGPSVTYVVVAPPR
jgi:hypothetical protein